MSIEKEYFNQILPLGNTPSSRSMFQVPANPTGGVVNLDTAFGPTGGGSHFLELKAMGAQGGSGASIHVAFSNSPTYTIGFGQMGGTGGVYTGVGWPLLHGETIRGRVPHVGLERSPTLAGYPGGHAATLSPAPYLHYRPRADVPTGAVLHVRQSSLLEGVRASEKDGFPVPY